MSAVPDGLLIRCAGPDDASAVVRAHVAAWKVAYRGLVDQVTLDAMTCDDERVRKWRDRLARPGDGATFVVCEVAGTVQAWAGYGQRRDDEAAGDGELMALYAHPDVWGSGAGPALIRHVCTLLDERFTSSVVWMFEGNDRAQAAYARHGFKPELAGVPALNHPEATEMMMRRDRPGPLVD